MIAICTPARDSVLIDYAASLASLVKETSEVMFVMTKGTYLNNMRSMLVKAALEQEADHILFIDSDMTFPSNTAARLLARDVDIIGANCKQRQQDQTTARKNGEFITSIGKSGIEEVDTLGMGVTLIKADVFKKLPEPWFDMPWDEKEKKHIGEDVYFCLTARRMGYKIFVEHDLSKEIGHIGLHEYRM